MDPNVTLSLIRSYIHSASEHLAEHTPDGDTKALEAFSSMVEKFDELDNLIKNGGFVPMDWLPITVR